jgi:hypothetical protein
LQKPLFPQAREGDKKICFDSSKNPNLRICRSIFFNSSVLPQAKKFLCKYSPNLMSFSLIYIFFHREDFFSFFVFLFLVTQGKESQTIVFEIFSTDGLTFVNHFRIVKSWLLYIYIFHIDDFLSLCLFVFGSSGKQTQTIVFDIFSTNGLKFVDHFRIVK